MSNTTEELMDLLEKEGPEYEFRLFIDVFMEILKEYHLINLVKFKDIVNDRCKKLGINAKIFNIKFIDDKRLTYCVKFQNYLNSDRPVVPHERTVEVTLND